MYILNKNQIPDIGKCIVLGVSLSGKTKHELCRINNYQFSVMENGKHVGFVEYDDTSKWGHTREQCTFHIRVVNKFHAEAWLQPLPEHITCRFRRLLAEKGIAQKALVWASEFHVAREWETWGDNNPNGYTGCADTRCGEDERRTDDWKGIDDEFDPESSFRTDRYKSGTAAFVTRIISNDTTTRRAEKTVRVIVNPKRKDAAYKWLSENLFA